MLSMLRLTLLQRGQLSGTGGTFRWPELILATFGIGIRSGKKSDVFNPKLLKSERAKCQLSSMRALHLRATLNKVSAKLLIL